MKIQLCLVTSTNQTDWFLKMYFINVLHSFSGSGNVISRTFYFGVLIDGRMDFVLYTLHPVGIYLN